jgi:uncharacterized membrane protein YgcG
MTQVTKGAFVADKDSGNGNGSIKITVPKNTTGQARYGQFLLKNAARTKQIIVFCRQNTFTIQKIDFVYEFIDRGATNNDGTNVILEGRLLAFKHGTTQLIEDNLFFNPMIKIGYVYDDTPTVKFSQTLNSNFKYVDFNLLIPIAEYEQATPFIVFNQEDVSLISSSYQYYKDIYSVQNFSNNNQNSSQGGTSGSGTGSNTGGGTGEEGSGNGNQGGNETTGGEGGDGGNNETPGTEETPDPNEG